MRVLTVSYKADSGECFDEWIVADSPRNAAVHRIPDGSLYCWECSSPFCEHCNAVRRFETDEVE